MKVVTILIPSFHGLRQERGAYKLGPTDEKKKRRQHFKILALPKQERLISPGVIFGITWDEVDFEIGLPVV